MWLCIGAKICWRKLQTIITLPQAVSDLTEISSGLVERGAQVELLQYLSSPSEKTDAGQEEPERGGVRGGG